MTDRERWIALRKEVMDRILGGLYVPAGRQALIEVAEEMERLLPFGELVRDQMP